MSNEELVQAYHMGDSEALEQLVTQNMGIIYKVANRYTIADSPSIAREDLEQEGVIGLMMACDRYQFDKGAKFSSYAFIWVRQRMSRFIEQRQTNEETSIDEPMGGDESDLTLGDTIEDDRDHIGESMLRMELDDAMDKYVAEDSRNILKLVYGWDDGSPRTLQEAAKLSKTTHSKARALHNKGKTSLRGSPWGREEAIYREQGEDYKNVDALIYSLDNDKAFIESLRARYS